MVSQKRFLVTGGAGFLGEHVCRTLAERGADVVSVDLEPMADPLLLEKVNHSIGDVRDHELLRRLMEGVDVVVHAAAALPLWSADEIHSVNEEGTLAVLSTAHELGVGRVVHISSTAVYGVPKKHPIEETDALVGVGAYGKSKIAAEKLCRLYREKGLCVSVIRPKTFIGTGRLGVFQILFDWVQKGAKIPIIGTGNNRYQLLEVGDLVEAIVLASTAESTLANDDFNVGADRFGTVQEDVGALCAVADSGSRVFPVPALLVKPVLRALELAHLSPLYKWVYGTADKESYVSIEKIKERLGWQPKKSNADTLVDTYLWYVSQYQEYRGGLGVTHKVAWDQGALKLARRLMGGKK
jgi:nucleoside-diphosphate-sugar epimerase